MYQILQSRCLRSVKLGAPNSCARRRRKCDEEREGESAGDENDEGTEEKRTMYVISVSACARLVAHRMFSG